MPSKKSKQDKKTEEIKAKQKTRDKTTKTRGPGAVHPPRPQVQPRTAAGRPSARRRTKPSRCPTVPAVRRGLLSDERERAERRAEGGEERAVRGGEGRREERREERRREGRGGEGRDGARTAQTQHTAPKMVYANNPRQYQEQTLL